MANMRVRSVILVALLMVFIAAQFMPTISSYVQPIVLVLFVMLNCIWLFSTPVDTPVSISVYIDQTGGGSEDSCIQMASYRSDGPFMRLAKTSLSVERNVLLDRCVDYIKTIRGNRNDVVVQVMIESNFCSIMAEMIYEHLKASDILNMTIIIAMLTPNTVIVEKQFRK